MPDWDQVPLGEVLTRSKDTITLDPNATYKQVTVRMRHKGVTLREQKKGAEIGSPRQYVARPGQFIISSIDARNGAMGLVPGELDGAIVTNDFWLFNVDNERLDQEWLRLYSSTAAFVEACTSASEGTTNRVRLKPDRFLQLDIPLPPLPEQQRIVARIKSMLEKVEEAKLLRQESSEKMAALIKSAINHLFDKHSSHHSVNLESACNAIIDNLHSNPEYSDIGIPCIRSSDVSWFEINLNSARRTSEEEYARRTIRGEPMPNDIVLVREGGGTGKAAIVREGQKFSLGQRVMMLRPNNERIIPEFLLHQILSPKIQDDYIASNFKGSAAPHLNIGSLRKFPILLPPIDTQQQILSELNSIYEKYSQIAQQSKDSTVELDALPASILARAFAGAL